jgi:ribosome-binding factor A
MTNRLEKVNQLLRTEAAKIVHDEIELKTGALVTITRATVSPTLEHATIWISVFPKTEEENVLQKINAKIYALQQLLNKKLSMRPVPKIRFDFDRSEEKASKLDEIFEKLAR